jgi:NitT/TauT family transport system substrate-binding protein
MNPPHWLAAAAVALVTSGCARGAENAAGGWTTLKVVVAPYLTYAPIFIAADEGFFAEERLRVEPVRIVSSAEGLPALDRGSVDVLGGGLNAALLNAIARGAGIRVVADKGYVDPEACDSHALMVRRTLAPAGRLRPSALRRRRVAVNRAALTGYYLDTFLRREGVSLGDLEIVDVPDSILSEAFRNGSIEAAVTSEPWITRIERTGQAIVALRATQIVPGFPYGFIVYGRRLREDDPDLGRRFMAAYLAGVRRYEQGKTPRNLDILVRHTRLERAVLEDACWPAFRRDGGVDIDAVLAFQRWALDRGLVDAPIDARAFWDPGFLEATGGNDVHLRPPLPY